MGAIGTPQGVLKNRTGRKDRRLSLSGIVRAKFYVRPRQEEPYEIGLFALLAKSLGECLTGRGPGANRRRCTQRPCARQESAGQRCQRRQARRIRISRQLCFLPWARRAR